ncbi:MAG: Type IV leader peptidase family protein [Pelotomaculum sp. PtaB.Bin104]|nr:MAG: Type IV leader peptidase family protein [Pelotomaculum sp. PtaB.Bin104]
MPCINLFLAAILAGICAWSDAKTMKIPNQYTYPFALAGLLLCLTTGQYDKLYNALTVFLFYLLLVAFGTGVGDLKLATVLALFLGQEPVLYGTLIAAMVMCLYGVTKTFYATGQISAVVGVLMGKVPAGAVPFGALMGPASVLCAWFLFFKS